RELPGIKQTEKPQSKDWGFFVSVKHEKPQGKAPVSRRGLFIAQYHLFPSISRQKHSRQPDQDRVN
ncbi:hypothetical protein, partial [Rouxiella chamberiensis]|uniref:hypothetical protein n=1 Tax=Rouxiella chamberiensis TaxID=1513468 RepID=UPI0019D3ECBD